MKPLLIALVANLVLPTAQAAPSPSVIATPTLEVVQTPSPTFLLKGKQLPVAVNGTVNPEFLAHLKMFISKDAVLQSMDLSQVSITFRLSDKGTYIGSIHGFDEEDVTAQKAKMVLTKIIASQIKYRAAQVGGQAVRYELPAKIQLN